MRTTQRDSNVRRVSGKGLAGHSKIVVGRKGTGKTTFFEVLKKYNPIEFNAHYKSLKTINVESINMESLFDTIERYKNDANVFPEPELLGLFWELFFVLSSMQMVLIEEENHSIRDDRRDTFESVSIKLKFLLNTTSSIEGLGQNALFALACESVEKFLKNGIFTHAKEKYLIPSILANTNALTLLSDVFGNELFAEYLVAFERCAKKTLVSLDGFDTKSEDYRNTTRRLLKSTDSNLISQGERREEFEKIFYRSMVSAVHSASSDVPWNNIDFCVILPRDRLDQLETVDRDISKKKLVSLSWDAIDLLEMVVLRLEPYYKISPNENDSHFERWSYILEQHLPHLPSQIAIEIGGKKKSIDLFQYLLRNSFWRPRDILVHLAELVLLSECAERDKMGTISDYCLKQALNRVTEENILSQEFFDEYKNVFYNIKEVMRAFRRGNLIMTYKEASEILTRIEFDTSISMDTTSVITKMRLLYELDALGILFSQKVVREHGMACQYCFSFNEGIAPFELLENDLDYLENEIKVIINPVFSKYLMLNMNTDDVVGNFGWVYLRENHMMKSTIKRS